MQPCDIARRTAAIAASRQPDTPLETTLGQFQTVDHGGPQLGRQHAASRYDEVGPVDRGFDALRIDTGQRHQDQDVALGLDHIDRRLP